MQEIYSPNENQLIISTHYLATRIERGLTLKKIFFYFMSMLFVMVSSSAYAIPTSNKEDLLREIYMDASKGEVPNSHPFKIGSKVEDIIQAWGDPDYNFGALLPYSKQSVMFVALTKTQDGEFLLDKVTHIFPYSEENQGSEIEGVTLPTLIHVLGQPSEKSVTENNELSLDYVVNNYHLIFVMQKKDDSFIISSYFLSQDFPN